MENFIWWLIVGGVAGTLAGLIMKGSGFGLVGDIIAGIVGAVVGGWLFSKLGISFGDGMISAIATATIGAVIVLLIVKMIKKA